MNKTFFSKRGAEGLVGLRVEIVEDFETLPLRTQGNVTEARRRSGEDWVVCVKWDLPAQRSTYFAMIMDLSINIPLRTKKRSNEFSKDEFERFLRCVGEKVS